MSDINDDTESELATDIELIEDTEESVADAEDMPDIPQLISTERPALNLIIEGALMASGKPLTIDHLAQLFAESERPDATEIQDALVVISEACEDRGFELKQVASGYRFQVKQTTAPWVSRLWEEKPQRYTRALLETLALIAYRQPITRGEIEEVRGVSVSSNIIRTLQEREWVRVVGHRDVPGRPAMFATTRHFLDYFNLENLNDLPSLSEIRDLEEAAKALESQTDMLENIEPEQVAETGEAEESKELAAETLFAELDEMEAELPENFNDLIKKQKVDALSLEEPADVSTEAQVQAEAEPAEPSSKTEEQPHEDPINQNDD